MLDNSELISNTITEVCSYYSKNDEVLGILESESINEDGIKTIQLIIICKNFSFVSDYFGFNNGSNKKDICDNVVLLIESKWDIEFGLLGCHLFEKGESSPVSFLANGKILYDKFGKYSELKKYLNKGKQIKRKIRPNTGVLVGAK